MFRPKGTTLIFLIVGLAVIAPLVRAQESEQSEREAMYYRYLEFRSYVKGGSIEPHWMADMERQLSGEESAGEAKVTHRYPIRVMVFRHQRRI